MTPGASFRLPPLIQPTPLTHLTHDCAGELPSAHAWLLHLAIVSRLHRAALHEFLARRRGWDVLVSIESDAAAMHRALHHGVGCCRARRSLRAVPVPLRDDAVLDAIVELAPRVHDGDWGVTSQVLDYGEVLPIWRPEAEVAVELELRRPGIAPARTDSELRREVRLRCARAAIRGRNRGGGPASSHT